MIYFVLFILFVCLFYVVLLGNVYRIIWIRKILLFSQIYKNIDHKECQKSIWDHCQAWQISGHYRRAELVVTRGKGVGNRAQSLCRWFQIWCQLLHTGWAQVSHLSTQSAVFSSTKHSVQFSSVAQSCLTLCKTLVTNNFYLTTSWHEIASVRISQSK